MPVVRPAEAGTEALGVGMFGDNPASPGKLQEPGGGTTTATRDYSGDWEREQSLISACRHKPGNLVRHSVVYYFMELDGIIAEICDQADDFLAGVTKREEAKAGISELITIHHADLPPAERRIVTEQSMRILEREGFFERSPGGED